jgi:hypothetical protein
MRKIGILLVCVALGFLVVACGSGSNGSGPNPSPTVQPSTPSTNIVTFNGQGPQNTDLFTVNGPTIEIDYQCEPSAIGNFTIVVYNNAGAELGIPVNTNCNSGTTQGTAELNASSGSNYLTVTAIGNWSIHVKG